jgi:hypothetical protein
VLSEPESVPDPCDGTVALVVVSTLFEVTVLPVWVITALVVSVLPEAAPELCDSDGVAPVVLSGAEEEVAPEVESSFMPPLPPCIIPDASAPPSGVFMVPTEIVTELPSMAVTLPVIVLLSAVSDEAEAESLPAAAEVDALPDAAEVSAAVLQPANARAAAALKAIQLRFFICILSLYREDHIGQIFR